MEENKNVEETSNKESESNNNSFENGTGLDENTSNVILAIGYFWILFILPLICCKKDEFTKHHLNQQIILFIVGCVVGVISTCLGFIPEVGGAISGIFGGICGLILLVVMIYEIIQVLQKNEGKLPVIGDIKILK